MIKYVSLAFVLILSDLAFAGGHGHFVQQQVVQKVIVPQRVVQFDAQYFQGTDHYYSLGEKLKAEKQEEKASEVDYYKGQIELLLKIIAAREGAGGRIIPNVPTPEPVLPAPTNPNPEVPPAPPEPVGNGPEEEYKVTELDKRVYDIFNAACVRCHGDTKQDGGLALVKGGALQLVDLVDRVEIYDRVLGVGLEARGKAKMPKGGTLSDNDVESLRLWMVQESDRLKNGGK